VGIEANTTRGTTQRLISAAPTDRPAFGALMRAGDAALAMSVTAPGAALEPRQIIVEQPPPGHVRVQVVASGVCYADVGTAAGLRASAATPVTPGHEIAGILAEVGNGSEGWQAGDRVAVGWFGGSCGHCPACRTGDVVHCPDRQTPGTTYPGGWAHTVTVPASALARVPEGLSLSDAAPMGCAGVTTFNALRLARIPLGGTVAVFGLGGLGHLAVQFAHAMGYQTIAVARGPERADAARQFCAHKYLDSTERPPGAALADLGGADLIVSTASTSEPAAELLSGLRVGGRLTLVGVDGGSVHVPIAQMVMRGHTLTGHLAGSPHDTERAMQFAVTTGVRPVLERLPLAQANEALDRVREGTARFRAVLDTLPAPQTKGHLPDADSAFP
jgi:D-arabinose 1-dehydrogenase-like Zn-dependent alcohol dehydrogenase